MKLLIPRHDLQLRVNVVDNLLHVLRGREASQLINTLGSLQELQSLFQLRDVVLDRRRLDDLPLLCRRKRLNLCGRLLRLLRHRLALPCGRLLIPPQKHLDQQHDTQEHAQRDRRPPHEDSQRNDVRRRLGFRLRRVILRKDRQIHEGRLNPSVDLGGLDAQIRVAPLLHFTLSANDRQYALGERPLSRGQSVEPSGGGALHISPVQALVPQLGKHPARNLLCHRLRIRHIDHAHQRPDRERTCSAIRNKQPDAEHRRHDATPHRRLTPSDMLFHAGVWLVHIINVRHDDPQRAVRRLNAFDLANQQTSGGIVRS